MAANNADYFRNDVQGIRTIGALLVAIFHIWIGGVSGGVDVFFVVSGYFLSIGFLRDYNAHKNPSIRGHYVRFLCRIVPPALIALLGITLLAFVFVSRPAWENQLKEIAASAVYMENWWLIKVGLDYLQRGADLSLVQHYWAVSLIGQVQLLWPLLLAFALWVARVWRRPAISVLVLILSAAAIASLVYSIVATAARPDSAYFDLRTRYWEFAIGALVGLTPGLRNNLPAAVANTLSWLGIALLVSCGFVMGSTAHFPGYAALWPISAAVLILLCGNEHHRSNAGYWLASRPLSGLGNLAFGIYLWHWPLLSIVIAALHGEKPSLALGLAIIFAATVLAFITKKLADGLNLFALPLPRAGAFAAVAIVLAISTQAGSHWIRHISEKQLIEQTSDASLGLRPSALAAHLDIPDVYDSKCHQTTTGTKPIHCAFGNQSAAFTVVLVGGSHSAHWLPALQEIAKQRDWRVISMTKSQCIFANFSDDALRIAEQPHPSCALWNQAALAEIIQLRPDAVVTIATRVVFSRPEHQVVAELIPDGYLSHFESLAAANIPVVAIRDTPWFKSDIPNCVYSPVIRDVQNCGGPREKFLHDASFAQAKTQLPQGIFLVDMTDAFCSDTQCGVTHDGILIYRDSHHITASYARTLSGALADRIAKTLPASAPNDPAGAAELATFSTSTAK